MPEAIPASAVPKIEGYVAGAIIPASVVSGVEDFLIERGAPHMILPGQDRFYLDLAWAVREELHSLGMLGDNPRETTIDVLDETLQRIGYTGYNKASYVSSHFGHVGFKKAGRDTIFVYR